MQPSRAQPMPLAQAQPAILEVRINGMPYEASRPMLRLGAQVLFQRGDIVEWQLLVPAVPALSVDGDDYFDMTSLPGVTVRLDEATQTVQLDVPPQGFAEGVARSRSTERLALSESALGAFLNYDVALQRDRSGTRASGFFDASASGPWGLASTSFLAGPTAFDTSHSATRLDTAYRWEDPSSLTRLTVGDSITRSASWSTPLRFGGVQLGTQFGLQPGYISYPTPSLHGGSALPSSVEVFVNDTLRYQGRADAGPFTVSDVPVLTGAGDMRFAVTDSLGVRRTVVTPYYVSSNLLRAGLSDYSVEFGWNRLFYGERSFAYGRPFASGNWRKGWNDSTTLELHAEAGTRSQTVGSGATWVWSPIGEFSLSGAASRSIDTGSGRLARASFTRIGERWNFSISRQVASRDFTQIAWQDDSAHVTAQTQAFAGRSLGALGSIGGSYTVLRYDRGEQVSVLSANWSIAIVGRASLSAYVSRALQSRTVSQRAAGTTSIGLTFSMPLGDQQTASLSVQRVDGGMSAIAEVGRTPPVDIDGGVGYRVLASRGKGGNGNGGDGGTGGSSARTEAGVSWLGRYGVATAEAASFGGDTGLRLRASGSVGVAVGSASGLMDAVMFATRQSDDAFALVEVPGSPGLKVYRENQHLATTDAQGRAIVPGLRAYESNLLSIDSTDLPIEATIGKDAIKVVPRFKGVAAARFDVGNGKAATVVVRLPDGGFLPPGIDVRSIARERRFISGYGGAVSIDQPASGEVFEARWRGGHCSFALGKVDLSGPLPSLGALVCKPLAASPP
jgi:outer membrane usher protein